MQDPLVEDVVLPRAGDTQIVRCHPELREPGAFQHGLGRAIVNEGARLDAVQLEIITQKSTSDRIAAVMSPRPVNEASIQ